MNLCICCLDALREDHVTPEIMPYLHSLAEAGTRYHNVTCKTAWTLSSVAAMLTGDDDAFKRGPQVGRPSLATLLSPTHDTAAFLGQGALWPTPEIEWLWEGFDYTWSYMREEGWLKTSREMEEVWAAFRDWRQSRVSPFPWFAYVHLYEVHEPYTTGPRKAGTPQTIENGYFANRLLRDGTAGINATEEEKATLRALYVDCCRATDKKLSHFLPQVLDGETILFLVTDHGDSHGERGVWGHGPGDPWQTEAARNLFWAVMGPEEVCYRARLWRFWDRSNATLPDIVCKLFQSLHTGDEVDVDAIKQRLADLGYLGGE